MLHRSLSGRSSLNSATTLQLLVSALPADRARELLVVAAKRHQDVRDLLVDPKEKRAHPDEIASLAEEAAEALQLATRSPQSPPGAAPGGSRASTFLASVDRLLQKCEGFIRSGHGAVALEALIAVAEELVRPSELPGHVWHSVVSGGKLGQLAFDMERSISMCRPTECQDFQGDIERLQRRLAAVKLPDLDDACKAVRLKSKQRQSTTL